MTVPFGPTHAMVAYTSPLFPEKALQKALTAHPDVGAGNSLTMSNVVDANIIGGIVVEVEDGGVTRVIDLSAKKKLSELKQLLAA